jgi:hypothetical protein
MTDETHIEGLTADEGDQNDELVIWPTDEEIASIACGCSQQDWNRLEYKGAYQQVSEEGAKWFRVEVRSAT